jgi:hypothetical protein
MSFKWETDGCKMSVHRPLHKTPKAVACHLLAFQAGILAGQQVGFNHRNALKTKDTQQISTCHFNCEITC